MVKLSFVKNIYSKCLILACLFSGNVEIPFFKCKFGIKHLDTFTFWSFQTAFNHYYNFDTQWLKADWGGSRLEEESPLSSITGSQCPLVVLRAEDTPTPHVFLS